MPDPLRDRIIFWCAYIGGMVVGWLLHILYRYLIKLHKGSK